MLKNKLKEVLSIPTYYGYESMVVKYIIGFAIENNIHYSLDDYGNVYLTKGLLSENEHYPCIVSHMDSVYKNQIINVITEQYLDIIEVNIPEDNDTYFSCMKGIGGDDKCGVFICLQLLLKLDKIKCCFFVEEEYGCDGSKNSDPNFFRDIGYIIQFDAPGDNWCSKTCSGVKLYDDEYFTKLLPLLEKYGITKISTDPYTDVAILRMIYGVNCFNFFAGYHNQHCGKIEYVSLNNVEKSINFGYDMVKLLGLS